MRPAYLAALRVAAASAAEPAFVTESPVYDSAKGQTTVTFQVSGFPSLGRGTLGILLFIAGRGRKAYWKRGG